MKWSGQRNIHSTDRWLRFWVCQLNHPRHSTALLNLTVSFLFSLSSYTCNKIQIAKHDQFQKQQNFINSLHFLFKVLNYTCNWWFCLKWLFKSVLVIYDIFIMTFFPFVNINDYLFFTMVFYLSFLK